MYLTFQPCGLPYWVNYPPSSFLLWARTVNWPIYVTGRSGQTMATARPQWPNLGNLETLLTLCLNCEQGSEYCSENNIRLLSPPTIRHNLLHIILSSFSYFFITSPTGVFLNIYIPGCETCLDLLVNFWRNSGFRGQNFGNCRNIKPNWAGRFACEQKWPIVRSTWT